MSKKLMFSLIVFVLLCPDVLADEILLKNGNIIEGNIISIDKDSNATICLVEGGKLTSMKIMVSFNDIKDLVVDDKYIGLTREKIPVESYLAKREITLNKKQSSNDIDVKIRQRVERQKSFIKDIEVRQEDKRRFKRKLQHEKEMVILETEMQKELIEFSKSAGVSPEVGVSSIRVTK